MWVAAVLAGCAGGWTCPTKERAVSRRNAEAGVDADTLAGAVPRRELLEVIPDDPLQDPPGEGDLVLAAIGPYTVRVEEIDPRDAVLRTQAGEGDFCVHEVQLRLPMRIRVTSDDGSLDVSTLAWAVGVERTVAFESELDPDAAALEGELPPSLEAMVRAEEADVRRTCPGDDEVTTRVRLHLTGTVGSERGLSLDTDSEAGCVRSAHALGAVALAPTE